METNKYMRIIALELNYQLNQQILNNQLRSDIITQQKIQILNDQLLTQLRTPLRNAMYTFVYITP